MLLHTLGRLSTTVNTQGRRIAARCFSSAVNFYDYDLLVLGGGSGGRACAAEAAEYDAKVGLFDYVDPSTRGTTWGLGGTCVNVGCIPKKIFHYASRLKEAQEDMRNLGFELPETIPLDWSTLVGSVQSYIRGLNFAAKKDMKTNAIDYFNERASFIDDHTIQGEDKNGKKRIVTAEKIVIATGGRPSILNIPGAREYAITSDDLFSLRKPPGKTLIVGASYIALECAGFLQTLGFDVSLMVRSKVLRRFDRDMADHISEYMKTMGTKFIQPARPLQIEKLNDNELLVHYEDLNTHQPSKEVFNTVMLATGRYAATEVLNCQNAGVKTVPHTHHVYTFNEESGTMQTSTPNIYCIGDARYNNVELTPVAIYQGVHLARHMFAQEDISKELSLKHIPSTVYTPLEYSFCGLSEEQAIELYGEDQLNIYVKKYNTLEQKACFREGTEEGLGFIKIIAKKSYPHEIVGLHMTGHSTSDVIQGLSVAMNKGLTKTDLDQSISIHPTEGEEIFKLKKTRELITELLEGHC